MTKLITGFETPADVEKALEWIERNAKNVWHGWVRPTGLSDWREDFIPNTERNGFALILEGTDVLAYCHEANFDDADETVDFKTFIAG